MGREIRKLIDNAQLPSGEHKILWDGKATSAESVSTGVYYYRLFGEGVALARSMILLK